MDVAWQGRRTETRRGKGEEGEGQRATRWIGPGGRPICSDHNDAWAVELSRVRPFGLFASSSIVAMTKRAVREPRDEELTPGSREIASLDLLRDLFRLCAGNASDLLWPSSPRPGAAFRRGRPRYRSGVENWK